ncbi:prephenate dehydratase [Futiania mangrovi]|uniref:prephenate dehydratase n=1 Tax=Futiania mangrovi TaxID=2959716 RepID=A0A9J6PK13_9PROT|nr:prephenate dehydratase [Futiania mangrovii]MCP1336887.1 prephenate dehydratase [Futiania mangrovii]
MTAEPIAQASEDQLRAQGAEPSRTVAFQGEPGAYSHLACLEALPDMVPLACPTFEDSFAAVKDGRASRVMTPIENSVYGRVADIHHLLPESGLFIVAEHFLRVRHQLLALKGASLETLTRVMSHAQALGQCRMHLRSLGLKAVTAADTAGSARIVAESDDRTLGALASSLAAEIYGLEILRSDMEDAGHNTTRFLVLSEEPDDAEPEEGPCITSFVFRVRNVPAALYKTMGGFATNGVNITKLESYQLEGSFAASQFYADIEGHPEDVPVRRALEELEFFTKYLKILGVYKAHPYRRNWSARAGA